MALVRVLSPESEPELAVARSLLEAHDIPVFVHGRHVGSLLPGLQIDNYNTQSIMVPEECVTDALELLAAFRRDNSACTALQAPEAHPHAVLVPGPVRDIGNKWLLLGRRAARYAPSRGRCAGDMAAMNAPRQANASRSNYGGRIPFRGCLARTVRV